MMTIFQFPLRSMTSFVISSDSISFLERCNQRGLATRSLMHAESLDPNSIIFSFSDNAAKRTFELAKLTPKKKCIFCPTHVFDPSINNALYGLEKLLTSDIKHSLAEQKKVLELVNSQTPLKLLGRMTQATVNISNNATPYAIIENDLGDDFIHSVAEFFEVHFAHMKPQDKCPFLVSGIFRVAGILSVLRNTEHMDPHIKSSINSLIGSVASKQAILKVSENIVISFMVGDQDYTELIQRAAGPRGAHLTEFAIGVNRAISRLIDFSINSQMNEGVSGVHVAVGDGTTGYHIDFLCPDVVVRPAH